MAHAVITGGNNAWYCKLSWFSTPNPDSNTSQVTVEIYMGGYETYGSFWGNIWIGDTFGSYSFDTLERERLVGSLVATVPHDSDGNASVSIRTECWPPSPHDYISDYLYCEETAELDRIEPAKPSRITCSPNPQQMGKKILISLERDQKDCTHTLFYSFGGKRVLLAKEVKSHYEWLVPDLTADCPDALSGPCTVICETYRKRKRLGTTRAEITLRVPDPTVPAFSGAVLGTETRIPLSPGSGSFTHSLVLCLQGEEYPVGSGKDEVLWTPPYELARVLPGEKLLSGRLRCITFHGKAEVGREECSLQLTVPENDETRPRIRALTLLPVEKETDRGLGYLRGRTGLKAIMEVTCPCSQPAEYWVTAGSQSAEGNPAVIPILSESGSIQVTAAVRDLRGFSDTVTERITVIPYEKPRVVPAEEEQEIICQRADSGGTFSRQGTYLALRAGIRYTAVPKADGETTSCILRYRRRQGEGPYGEWKTLLEGGKQEISTLLPGIVESTRHSYQVELSALDSLGEESRISFSVLSEAISFGLYDGVDGAAFGKYPEIPHVVDLAPQMTLLVRGKLELRGETWKDLGFAPGILPAAQKRGRGDAPRYRVHGGNQVILSFSCRMPDGDLAINSQPLPEALRPDGPVSGLCPSELGPVEVTLGTDGFLHLRTFGEGTPLWIDGSLDYFLN